MLISVSRSFMPEFLRFHLRLKASVQELKNRFTELNDDSGILLFLGVVGLKRTWDHKLSSRLMLLTFMSVFSMV